MADRHEDMMQNIAGLKAEFDAHLKAQADRTAEAVAKARAAWDADDQAQHDEAMAAIDEIESSLKSFSPSGN